MIRDQKDKCIAYFVAGISLSCYLSALIAYDTPSYELDNLKGHFALLHWCMIMYLPLFPFLALIFCGIISQTFTAGAVVSMNFLLTLLFAIFACCSGILSTSWILLSASSFVIMLAVQYDKRISLKDNR